MRTKQDNALRKHLVELLDGGHAHATFEQAIAGFPQEMRGRRPAGAEHSAWELLEHLRLAQWDILEFSRNPKHESPKWPEGYWPKTAEPPDAKAWNKAVKQFQSDMQAMKKLVEDPATDLFAAIKWGDRQTILREAMLVADHNAYHMGQIVMVRKILGAWKG